MSQSAVISAVDSLLLQSGNLSFCTLRFHDPRLANFLAQFAVDPELFAMSWFLTAFAHGTQIGTVERVWDTLIISDDPTLLHFIAVSTIMHFREDLLTAQVHCFPTATPCSASVYHVRAPLEPHSVFH